MVQDETFFKVGSRTENPMRELVPLKAVDMTRHFTDVKQGERRIIIEDKEPDGGVRHLLVTSWVDADPSSYTVDGGSGRLKVTDPTHDVPDYMSIRGGKAYLLKVEPYSMQESPEQPLSNKDKTDMAVVREDMCNLAVILRDVELTSRRTSQDGIIYTRPGINVDSIRTALTPYSSHDTPGEVAEHSKQLDPFNARFIRSHTLGGHFLLPAEIHSSVLRRIGDGRFPEESDRDVASVFSCYGEDLVCPLLSPKTNNPTYKVDKLWVAASEARRHINTGHDDKAAEVLVMGFDDVLSQLEIVEPVSDKPILDTDGNEKKIGDDEGERNYKTMLSREYKVMRDNPEAVVRMMKKSFKAFEIAHTEGGEEFGRAFEQWAPVFLHGMNHSSSHESISFESMMREDLIRKKDSNPGDQHIVMKNIVLRSMEAVGTHVREGQPLSDLYIDTNFDIALTWSTALQIDHVRDSLTWNHPADELSVLSEGSKRPVLEKALKKLL